MSEGGQSRSTGRQLPWSAFVLDNADPMSPIFQAGHAGSIPVARSRVLPGGK